MVSGSGDHSIKLWDIESGHMAKTLSGHTQEVVRILFFLCVFSVHTPHTAVHSMYTRHYCLRISRQHDSLMELFR